MAAEKTEDEEGEDGAPVGKLGVRTEVDGGSSGLEGERVGLCERTTRGVVAASVETVVVDGSLSLGPKLLTGGWIAGCVGEYVMLSSGLPGCLAGKLPAVGVLCWTWVGGSCDTKAPDADEEGILGILGVSVGVMRKGLVTMEP